MEFGKVTQSRYVEFPAFTLFCAAEELRPKEISFSLSLSAQVLSCVRVRVAICDRDVG
jgi:hypothetical protein